MSNFNHSQFINNTRNLINQTQSFINNHNANNTYTSPFIQQRNDEKINREQTSAQTSQMNKNNINNTEMEIFKKTVKQYVEIDNQVRDLKEQDKINKEIKSAFAYPTFMIVVSLAMISFMLTFVVPQITGIFENMGQALPAPTIFVIAVGDFFNENFPTILTIIVLSITIFTIMMKKSYHFAYSVHKMILKLPLFGVITQKSELARFAYIASLLTRSGVPFVQTVNLSANILNNLMLKKLFLDASTKVVEGKLLSKALLDSDIKVDYAFIQSIALGEETSQIENVLTNVSELYFEENRDKISTLLTLLEPSLMLFVGGSIGFIVAAMLLPIFSMSIH